MRAGYPPIAVPCNHADLQAVAGALRAAGKPRNQVRQAHGLVRPFAMQRVIKEAASESADDGSRSANGVHWPA